MAEPPRKRARVSKNKKKNWRKHTDVNDVEEYLEDVRVQERTGGIVAEKTDDQLFFVDVGIEPDQPEDETTGDKTKIRKRSVKTKLKCHALLEPDPNTKAARIQTSFRKSVRNKEKQLNELKQENAEKSATRQNARKQQKDARDNLIKKIKAKRTLPVANYDLWGQDSEKTAVVERNRNKPNIKEPTSLRRKVKPSELPSVEVPHPGASYNPTYEDHQELLTKAKLIEYAKDRDEKRVERALAALTTDRPEKVWLEEMSAGLYDEDEASEDEEDAVEDEEDEEENSSAVRREDKKTRTQRNKEKINVEKEMLAKKKKEENMKKSEIFRLRTFKAEIKAEEMKLKQRAEKKAELAIKNKDNPKKLGKLKYSEADIEIKTTDELVGSLRMLKPEGNLLADRFNSLQKRNVIEPRKRAKHVKKYKRKEFDKKSHRDVKL